MSIRLLDNLIKIPLSALLILILVGSVIANSNMFFVHSQSVPMASPSLPLSSIFDIPNMKIISSNTTGYEAEAPLKNSFSGLVWHISVNTKPHVQYTPTQKDIQRIQSTGQPLYNVNTQNAVTHNIISSKISFFIPYSALAGSSPNPSSLNTRLPQSQLSGGGNSVTNPSPGTPSTSSSPPIPTANDQSITTNVNNPISITLGGSSSNPNADLTATIVNNPVHGTLSQIDQQTGVVTYTPNQDYIGTDSFTFKVNDGNQDSSNTGTVSITVTNGSGNGNSNSDSEATDGNNQQTQQQQNAHFQTQLQKLSLSSKATAYSAVAKTTTLPSLLSTSSSLPAAVVIPVAEVSSSSSPSQQPSQGNGEEKEGSNTGETIDGVRGIIFQFLEQKGSPIAEGLIGEINELFEKVSDISDFAGFGKDILDTSQELKELEDCRESTSFLQQPPGPEGTQTGDEQINNAKRDIIVDFLAQGFGILLSKFPIGETSKPLEMAVTKEGDSIVKADLAQQIAYIKAVSKCMQHWNGKIEFYDKGTGSSPSGLSCETPPANNDCQITERHTGDFVFNINVPFTITGTSGPQTAQLDKEDLKIVGDGNALVYADSDCGLSTTSKETFRVQGTFNYRTDAASIQFLNVSPDSFHSAGPAYPKCLLGVGLYDMTSPLAWGNSFPTGSDDLGEPVIPNNFDLDLSKGHVDYFKWFSGNSFIKITVDRQLPSRELKPFSGSQQPQPELKPFSGKIAQSTAGSSALSSFSHLTATDQSISINANNPVSITLGGSSSNPNADLTASIVSPPSHGTLSTIDQATGKVTYKPQSGYTGQDSFTFKVNDGKSDSNNTGTVSISIGGKAATDVSAPSTAATTTPTAADQSITASTKTPVDITLSGTDPNPNADLSASIVSNPAHGMLSQIDQATGKVTYTPQSGYTGPDSFTFKVNDGNLNSNAATVNITIK